MRYIIALIVCIYPLLGSAQEWEDQQRFNDGVSGPPLRIIASTDTALFAPIIESFISENPTTAIEYLVTGTADIDRRFRADPNDFDLVISSAMDLQLKLTNDGLALPLEDIFAPAWAQWRQSLFAFTSEPAAIVINRAAFTGHAVPQSRQDLIQAMRARPEIFRNRIGTYDVRQSGLGYLFATQDARASETYWRLMEVMGSLDVRLYCCSGDMIDDLADGTIAVAYNVLGSYAAARIESKDTLEIILPSDFPTTMMRTAMVSRDAPNPALAEMFIRHLITRQSRPNEDSLLPPLSGPLNKAERATIALEPALMTFLDGLKRRKFLAEWEDAVIQK
ncbi:ABC transporter substrate-binding protein [Litoreibacter roseus]|uniref:Periplasmic iron-binding protein n=1 Tax=Litoreibacter roseus TaxID=2601869 RepID=A0A6N6JJG6_9RHOB|nr:ABC transporter substrate-binding protein [Litoreibacter roseus]GFE66205.1 periplasmic iron-binding protein [Litoreibacter roseus]